MSAQFIPSEYPGGRMCLTSGNVIVGAVFPPVGQPPDRLPWVWRLWVNGAACATDGRAKTELAAKVALQEAWMCFLQAAALAQVADQIRKAVEAEQEAIQALIYELRREAAQRADGVRFQALDHVRNLIRTRQEAGQPTLAEAIRERTGGAA